MTDYTTLSDTTLAQDKPFTQSVSRALRDNPIAISEGSASAPKLLRNGMRVAMFTASGTFNVPSDVTQIWAEVAGAGGGGGYGSGGGNGGTTTFNGVSATGGTGGETVSVSGWGARTAATHGSGSSGDINISGGGAAGGKGCTNGSLLGFDGANGGYAFKVMTVTPGASLTVTIGAGGTAGSGGGKAGVGGG